MSRTDQRGVLHTLADFFGKGRAPRDHGGGHPQDAAAQADFAERVRCLNRDPYLFVADDALKLISVFDDLKYDRADLDMLSEPMRRRVLTKLTPFGFRQVSGSLLENRDEDIRMHLPKFRALGASPFDACRDTPRREQDYYVLTPTQTVCQILDAYPLDNALVLIEALVVRHPANLLRIADFLEKNDGREAVLKAIGHLRYLQRKAVETEPLRTRRALR